MSPVEILGILSAALLLAAFAANQYGALPSDDIRYDLFNALAAAGLFAYAYHLGAVPFMITNAVWGLVAGIDVIKGLSGGGGLKRGGK